MKCRGKFKFKGLIKKDSGEFINGKGEKVSYNESYTLKVDELTEEGVFERVFKLKTDSSLIDVLKDKELYSDIILDFDVVFYASGIRIIPISLVTK